MMTNKSAIPGQPLAFRRIILVLSATFVGALGVLAQTNFATLVGDGAWTWYNDPRALYHNGKLYFGYVRAADSKTVLSALDLSTGQVLNLWSSGFTQRDDHNNPGLLAKQDGTLLAVYARHGSDQYFAYRRSTTTNPTTAGDWAAEQSIPNSGAGMTYANPFQLSAESGRIYNFCRNTNYNPTIYTSTDGGSNWSAPQWFIRTGAGGTRPYVKYCSDYDQRIEFLYTDGHPRDVANSLYHLYYQGGAFYQTDGTLVKNYASLPILHDSGERGSVIYQYSDADTADPNDHIPTGRAWCWETAYQSNGAPVCVFTVQRDNIAPSGSLTDRIYYYYARWTGTSWQKRFVAQAGRPLYNAEDDYAGGICIDPLEPNVIYISSNAQDPFNLTDTTNVTLRANERYELWRGVTGDGGLTFAWTQITANSTSDNLRPYIPRRNGGEPCVIWFRGTYSSYTSYACSIVGLFTTAVPTPVVLTPPLVSVVTPVGAVASLNSANDTLQVSVTVSNPVPANPLTATWSQLAGPAPVAFANSNATSTAVSFSSDGIYSLAFTANNGLATNVTVTVLVDHTAAGITNGLAAWWKMDETGGAVAADSSGNGRPATVVNGTFTGGYVSNAIQFASTTSRASYSAQQSNQVTVTAWVRADGTGGGSYPRILDTPSYRVHFRFTGADSYSFGFATSDQVNGDYDSGAGTVALGAWYHVAVSFDRASLATPPALYLNGSKMTTSTLASPSGTAPSLSGTGYIGNRAGLDRYWNGLIDDLRIYNRVLSDGEVLALAVAPSANVAPVVSAGTNQTVIWPAFANLSGDVTDDGKPTPPGTTIPTWSMTSGPGAVTFGNSNTLSTAASFSVPGSYLLQLAADDGQAQTVSRMTVNVITAPTITYKSLLGALRLTWPANSGIWRLQAQTNALGSGLGTNWADVPNSSATNQMQFPIDPACGAVFYRLVWP